MTRDSRQAMPGEFAAVTSREPTRVERRVPGGWFFVGAGIFVILLPAAMIAVGQGVGADNFWVAAALVAFTAAMMFCWTSALHEAAHQTLFRSRALSIWTGRLLGTLMFTPYTAYREVHIRHHAYLNSPRDWELWPYDDPRASLAFRRSNTRRHTPPGRSGSCRCGSTSRASRGAPSCCFLAARPCSSSSPVRTWRTQCGGIQAHPLVAE